MSLLLWLAGGALASTVHYVDVVDDAFDPPLIEVEAGDSVRWVFQGPSQHSVTAAAGQIEAFDSGLQSPGTFYEVRFGTVGGVAYYCTLAGQDLGGGVVSGMSGSVVVLPAPPLDSDGDGVSDDDEIMVHGTDPLVDDTDGGGRLDGAEIDLALDPLDPADDLGALTLLAPPPVAGTLHLFEVSEGWAGESVILLRAAAPGATAVPGCPGVTVDLAAPVRADEATVGATNTAALQLFVPAGASGKTGYFQAVEPSTCRVSGRVELTWP